MVAQAGSITTLGALGITFIVLKLTEVINWSWLWVLAPFWIPVAIALAFVIAMLIVYLIS